MSIWIDSILEYQEGQDWIEAGLLPYMKFQTLYIRRHGVRMSYWVWLEEMMAIVGKGKFSFFYQRGRWEEDFVTKEDLAVQDQLPTIAELFLDGVDPNDFDTCPMMLSG